VIDTRHDRASGLNRASGGGTLLGRCHDGERLSLAATAGGRQAADAGQQRGRAGPRA
jgi:hypothetical protein